MPFDLTETTLPGVGKKYEIHLDEERCIAVVIESTGRRKVLYRGDVEDDYTEQFHLTDSQARTLGLLLVGAYFQPIAGELPEETEGGEFIKWYPILEDAPVRGDRVGDIAIEKNTNATVLGIERDGDVRSTIGDEFVLAEGDRVILLGTDDAHRLVRDLLRDA